MNAIQTADANVRHRIRTELDKTFFVEAGAGTGKTSILVSRVVALVAAGQLRMERLAAITFTEAAAAELRDRIRQELERAAASGLGPDAELCAQAAREVDLAAIQTIHSFAGALLRTYPLEAQLPPNFTMLDDVQQSRNFEERFRAWLYDEVPAQAYPERRTAVGHALALGMSPDELRELARRLQDYRDLINPNSSWPSPAPQDPVAVAQRWGRLLGELSAASTESFDPNDKLVLELRRLGALAERLRDVDDADEALRLLVQVQPKQGGDQRNWPRGRCK
jgi:ATP-dependent helicase/nuclease subunit A